MWGGDCSGFSRRSKEVSDEEPVNDLDEESELEDTLPLKRVKLGSGSSENNFKYKGETKRLKIGMDSGATGILTALVLDKALSHLKKLEEEDENDEDYVPLDGLPEDVIYMEEEEEYVKKLNEEDRKNIFKLEERILTFDKAEIPQRFKILNCLSAVSPSVFII